MTQTLWSGEWIETPRPHAVAGSAVLEVEATVPILPLGAVHGREFGSPLRKVASFALTDGPKATARKVRSKRAEGSYSGDLHLVLALGRIGGGERVVALVPRAPRCASSLLVHAGLTRPAAEELGPDGLAPIAAAVGARSAEIGPLVRQSYLYSGMQPPALLAEVLDAAIAEPARSAARLEPLTPPASAASSSAEAETIAIAGAARAPGTGSPLAILGAGDYVRIEVAPALAAAELERVVIADREPQIAALAAAELGFATASTDAEAAIEALERRGLVVVATAHDSHAALAARALEAGHRVLCEKPAIVTPADLDLLDAAASAHPGELEVGFNRRHHPLVERARRAVARESGPATIVATIREVDITPDHWYLWPNQGTRVAGNLCHWIDLALHLLGGGDRAPRAVSVTASPRVSDEPTGLDAERSISVAFDEGSVVTLVPTARGDSVRGVQEQIEVRRGDLTVRIDDLWRLAGVRAGVPLRRRSVWRDKGHGRMYAESVSRFTSGRPASYPAADLRRVGEIQIAAAELLRSDLASAPVEELLTAARERAA